MTGVAGLVAATAIMVQIPLYFVHPGAPPDSNVLTRSLLGLISLACLLVFMTSVGSILRDAGPAHAWVGTLVTGVGTAMVTVVLVSTGLEVGAVIAAAEPIDPTVEVSGTYILYGSIARLLEAVFLGGFAFGVLKTRVLPAWTGWTATALAAVNLAFVPSLYFGNTPAHFYAANGWGTTAAVGGLFTVWVLMVSIATLTRARRQEPEVTVAPSVRDPSSGS